MQAECSACADYLICQSSSEFRRNDSGTPKTCQNSSNGVCPLICSRPFKTFFFPCSSVSLSSLAPRFSPPLWLCPRLPRCLSIRELSLSQDEGAAVGASDVAPSGRTVVRQGSPLVTGAVEEVCKLLRSGLDSGVVWRRPCRASIKDPEETNTRHFCLGLCAQPLLRDGDKTRR